MLTSVAGCCSPQLKDWQPSPSELIILVLLSCYHFILASLLFKSMTTKGRQGKESKILTLSLNHDSDYSVSSIRSKHLHNSVLNCTVT